LAKNDGCSARNRGRSAKVAERSSTVVLTFFEVRRTFDERPDRSAACPETISEHGGTTEKSLLSAVELRRAKER